MQTVHSCEGPLHTFLICSSREEAIPWGRSAVLTKQTLLALTGHTDLFIWVANGGHERSEKDADPVHWSPNASILGPRRLCKGVRRISEVIEEAAPGRRTPCGSVDTSARRFSKPGLSVPEPCLHPLRANKNAPKGVYELKYFARPAQATEKAGTTHGVHCGRHGIPHTRRLVSE